MLSHLALMVVVLSCLEIPLGYLYVQAGRERGTGVVKHEAHLLAGSANQILKAGRPDQLPRLAYVESQKIRGNVAIVDQAGQLLVGSRWMLGEDWHDLHHQQEIKTALQARRSTAMRRSRIEGIEVLHIAVPIDAGGAVRITIPRAALETGADAVWLLLAAVALMVMFTVVVVVLALSRWITRPIRRLENAMNLLATGHLLKLASAISGPREVRRLAETFNETALRLQRMLASQGSFAANASHELRTPLTALRLRLENLEPDIAYHAHGNLHAALAETDRLARMVERLLTMAKLAEHTTAREPTHLAPVIQERARTWGPLAENRGVRLLVEGEGAGRVWAVPGAVEQIIDNLLSNALRVSPPGGTLTVECRLPRTGRSGENPTTVALHVIDQGPGMSEMHRQRAFDRFWRAPGAPNDGTGLGLSLVRQLAHACGGEVTLAAAPGGGTDAVVVLQSAEQPAVEHDSRPWWPLSRLWKGRSLSRHRSA
ncbi:sensor histidine kinase [Streptosporangium sp. NPDC004631]